MLRKLELYHVGPGDRLQFEPALRFNLITGDNGLGKSFLLEASWWALTRTWHEVPAVPTEPDAYIAYRFDGDVKTHSARADWDVPSQQWKRKAGRPPNSGLVLYARVDGSFSAWDPARNYRLYQRASGGEAQSPDAYQFSSSEVYEGLKRQVSEGGVLREQVLCAGLIDDWVRWQQLDAPQFDLLRRLLLHLGPDEQPLEPGKPRRPTLDDVREIPTIRMPYRQEVPLTYCPAGVKRMCKLAYLLAWTLSEHRAEAERIGQPLSRQVIVLIDEPETHLHPRWQRTALPSLKTAIEEWNPEHKPGVQFLVATHSPLVLASMEPHFDPAVDALWKLDLVQADVVLERDLWHPRGDANRWLMSDVFDLGAATSSQTEKVLKQASELISQPAPDPRQVEEVDKELVRLLPEMDPFFVRWRYYTRDQRSRGGRDDSGASGAGAG
jgi:hypothetical protein